MRLHHLKLISHHHAILFVIVAVMVDNMLVESDKDNDGYISYAEYVSARRWVFHLVEIPDR